MTCCWTHRVSYGLNFFKCFDALIETCRFHCSEEKPEARPLDKSQVIVIVSIANTSLSNSFQMIVCIKLRVAVVLNVLAMLTRNREKEEIKRYQKSKTN